MTGERAAEVATDESLQVSLEDGAWDCDTLVHVRRRSVTGSSGTITTAATEIFLTDGRTCPKVVIFATLSGKLSCGDFDGLLLTGYLTLMSSDEQQGLTKVHGSLDSLAQTLFWRYVAIVAQKTQ